MRDQHDERPHLVRDEVLTAARSLVASHGLAALSMRRLAEDLEVWPTSIYHALGPGGKERLVEEVVDSIVAAMPIAPDQAPWDARLRAWCEGMRQGLLPYPGVAGWILTGPVSGPGSIRHTEALLRILRDAGLLREERGRFLIVIVTSILTTVQAEIGSGRGSTRLTEQRHFQESYAHALEAVPDEECALTRDLFGWLVDDPADGHYRWELEMVLRAIGQRRHASGVTGQRVR